MAMTFGNKKIVKPFVIDPLAKLVAFINKDDQNKADVLVKGSEIEITKRKTVAIPYLGETHEFSFNDHSFDQMSKMLGIPPKFLRTCPNDGKGSIEDIVSARMTKRLGENHFLRLRVGASGEKGVTGFIRGFLSSEYKPYDNRDLLAALQTAMRVDRAKFHSTNAYVPRHLENALNIRMLFDKSSEFEVEGDKHCMGVHLQTSEIGMYPVSVGALVWRLVCSNGLMGWSNSDIVSITHRNVEPHEISPRVEEAYSAAQRLSAPASEVLEALVAEPIKDPVLSVLRYSEKMKLPEAIVDKIMKQITRQDEAPPTTKYGLLQAFTAAAKGMDDLTDIVHIEKLIGKVLLGGGKGRGSKTDRLEEAVNAGELQEI